MSIIYAESNAVLRWLLGAADSTVLGKIMSSAETVVTSALTSAEVGRTLRRLNKTGVLGSDARDLAWAGYCRAAAHWDLFAVSEAILSRASEPFPVEPLRTLDAIHLATASFCAHKVQAVTVLSVDAELRKNAEALGLRVAP